MIIASDHGEVRYFRMASTAFGRAIYWTGVYIVDGLLHQTGHGQDVVLDLLHLAVEM